MMYNQPYKIGQSVTYRNGNKSIYSGIIAAVYPNHLVILEADKKGAGWVLWNAGLAVGDCISPSQIIGVSELH